ncbi:MAG TPA: cation diffusion facilitator family transporter [Bacteroidales bacterium]|nr:cation diffusion facilitator family transporter [Bacteroidales bacterium]
MVKDKEILKYYSKLEGWVSVVINILLAVLKYWAGLVSGSIALIADAWHTLSDTISSVVVIIGSRVSSKPADKTHPYGHGRFELVSTFIISILLFIVAFSFLKGSIKKIIDHEQATYGTIAIVVTILSIIIKELLAQFAFYCSKRSESSTLKADGWHHRSDAISSIIILLGIVLGGKIWWVDGLLGIIVAILIGWTAYQFTGATISSILGEKPDEELLNRIMEISSKIAGSDSHAHHFHLHDYVTHKELTFHINLAKKMQIEEAHKMATRIEETINSELDIHATIHIEPSAKAYESG